MAEMTDILRLRRMVGELTDAEPWTDQVLSDMIDSVDDLNQAALEIWEAKAAASAAYVDTTESGSSRRLSQVNEQALKMLDYYRGLTTNPDTLPPDMAGYAYTVAIERP